MKIRALTLTTLAVAALSACSGSSPADTKYQQTWTTPYSQTHCSDYLTQMTDRQRWVMAADMLTGARKVDGGSTVPADAVVTRFKGQLATACQGETSTLANEVAVVLYQMDSSYQP
ncbi:HdeA/HdeB family chaperone [Streptomyces sp. NPDC006640]|uniref:HdeA/HdeB family chaperone n=1 Tax=unclassified Streptomyces TaxID=2593676 RepID=UPI0036B1AAF8